MLNEFVSVVISGNEEHRKLMEKDFACFDGRRPVALIEVLVSKRQRRRARKTGAGGMRTKKEKEIVQ